MKKCKHNFHWQGRNPVNGINTELWDVCSLCGYAEQRHIVKIEPLKGREHNECKCDKYKWEYRGWRQYGYLPENRIPTELWQVCSRCGVERLVYVRPSENRLYFLGTKNELERALLLEYLEKET